MNKTYTIPIILGTSRIDNQSSKVAYYLQKILAEFDEVESIILDIGEADFPMLTKRVSADNPISNELVEWTSILKSANGIIIVSPEYKSGYPGSLKNFLDYLPPGIFRYKPVGISTVSSGVYAGTSCMQQLRQVVIAMAGLIIPDRFQIGEINSAFDEDSNLVSENLKLAAIKFISELKKYVELMSSVK